MSGMPSPMNVGTTVMMNSSRASKEGPDDLTSPHHPDVLATLLAEAFGKGPDRIRDELDAGWHGCRGRPAREHIMHFVSAEARAHLHTQVEGSATEYLGID